MSSSRRHILCQAFSNVLLESEDPDIDDSNDPKLCSNYVKGIYNNLRHLEIGRQHLRTFANNAVSKLKLLLVGVIAMYIATKYEEILHPYIGDFAKQLSTLAQRSISTTWR
ncbi:G2/mitotic-specific cyclin-B1 [Passerculus sandwichensis]